MLSMVSIWVKSTTQGVLRAKEKENQCECFITSEHLNSIYFTVVILFRSLHKCSIHLGSKTLSERAVHFDEFLKTKREL